MPELDKGWIRSVLRVTGDMRLRKKVGIDLKNIVAFHC